MTSKVKKGTAKKAKVAKIHEPKLVDDTPPEVKATASAAPKESKNIMTLDSGESILVRGPEKKRAGYHMGNVGWQDFLRECRLALNLATHAAKIGVHDKVMASLIKVCDEKIADLNQKRVTIPSDMTTQYSALKIGVPESPVGAPEYIIALRKISKLVQSANNPDLNKEVVNASMALKTAKA